MTDTSLFLLAHIAVLLWTAFVIWIAAVTNQAGLIGLFFVPAFGIDLLDRIPMGSVVLKGPFWIARKRLNN